MGIFDWKHWIVLLAVVVLVFGTKKLKNFGSDLGESIKGFRNAMNDDEQKPAAQAPSSAPDALEGKAPTNQGQTTEDAGQPTEASKSNS